VSGRARADSRRPRLDRRGFVRASLALACARVPHLRRPTDELAVAVVGLNGRGKDHVEGLRRIPGVRIAALCDVDDQVMTRELKRLRELGLKPDACADLRTILERSDIDAISIASPNHWHALQTIWACQAEKDVYVEKPATHLLVEGPRVVAAARRHERVVQCGMQSRSSPALRAAIEWVRGGNLGPMTLVRGLCYKPRRSIGKVDGNQKIPDSVDYDLWCGPSPLLPLRRARLHYDWHWVFVTGNGDLGNQGVHQLDIARWVVGTDQAPASVQSVGGRLGYEDDGDTPNTQVVLYGYEPVPMMFEVRGLPHDSAAQQGDWFAGMDDVAGVSIGVVVHCEGGTLRIPSYSEAIACDAEGQEIRRWSEGGDHFLNWIEAVRSRRVQDLAAEIEVGVRSSALVHLANASQRVGQGLGKEAFLAALDSAGPLGEGGRRMLAHLEANGIDPDKTPVTLGPRLTFDSARGAFQENERANALLTGSFREPYVLPS